MKQKLLRVAEKRHRLILQIAAQRSALGQDVESWRMPLARVDQGMAAVRYITTHPVPMVVGVVLLALVRPRHAGKWLGRAFVAWKVLHGLLPSLSRLTK